MSNIPQHGATTIRLSRAMYLRSQRAQLPVYGLVLIVGLLNIVNLRHHLGVLATIYGVGIVVSLLQLWLAFRNRKVEFDGSGFTVVNLFNRSRRFENTDVAALVFTVVTMSVTRSATVLLAIGKDGKRMVRITSLVWDPADQSALADSIGATPVTWEHPIEWVTLRKAYPQSVPWVEAHRVAFALIVAGGVFLIGSAAAFLAINPV